MPRSIEIEEPREAAPATYDHPGWGVPMAIGIALVLFGALALSAAVLTSLVTVVYLGMLLLLVGILEMVAAYRMRNREPFVVYFAAGVLSILVGGLFVFRPLASLAVLTLLVVGFFIASALFRGATAVMDRYPHWGWDLAYGVVALALGAVVAAAWPLSSLWVLGTVVGVEIIARGVTVIAAAWVVREIAHGHLPNDLQTA